MSVLCRGYWVFFGSSLVASDEVPLPLGVAVEPLGWFALELEELAPGWLKAPDDGLVALGEVELELELPALGELDGGVEGVVDEALLLEPGAGAVEVRSRSLSPQAARPRANATAIANVESLMCSSKVGYKQAGEQGSDRV